MRKHSLYSYSWNLPGNRNGAVDVARLRVELDELGIDGLTLAASYLRVQA